MAKYCACGCGQEIIEGKQSGKGRFIIGHWCKTQEAREILSMGEARQRAAKSLKQRWQTDRERLFEKVVVPLKSPENEAKRLEALRIVRQTTDMEVNRLNALRSASVRGRISQTLLGRKQSVETKRLKSIALKGKPLSEQNKQGIRMGQKRYWANLTMEEKRVKVSKSCGSLEGRIKAAKAKGRRPTKPELKLEQWLNSHYPNEWRYNGKDRGGLIIGNLVPDFINVNGRKAIIEVFGEYYHDTNKFPNRLTEKETIEHYKKFGFHCLVLWENEVYKEETLKEKMEASF